MKMQADLLVSPTSDKPELYSKDVLRLAAGLPHGDRLDSPDSSAVRRSPVCGSEIAVDIQADRDGRISALAFRARACAIGQASAALLRVHGVGRTAAEIEEVRNFLAEALSGQEDFGQSWPELAVFEAARAYPGRHAALLLPYDALLAALSDLN